MKDYVLKTVHLTKQYGKQIVLDDVNLNVKKGEIYGLVGRNGAGKTTIMRIICGLTKQNAGTIEAFGKTVDSRHCKYRNRIGNIIETPAFFPYMSAKDNLEYYRVQHGIPEENKVEELLAYVGLEHTGKKKFKQFSLGMKQRLGLAYALLGDPDLLVLDEPINGLDPEGIIEIREILKTLRQEKGTTIIISSHILSELTYLVDTYGFINKGRLIEEVSTKEIEERCKHHLLLKVKQTEAASVVLEKQLNCTDYEVISQNQIKVFNFLDCPEKLVKAMVQNDVELCTVQEVSGNLEEYFLKVMGDDGND